MVGKLFELGTRDLHTVAIGQGSTVAAKAPEAPQGAVARFNENKLLGLGVSAAAAVAAVAAAERTAAADKSDEACIVYEGAEVCGPVSFTQGAEGETCVYDGLSWVCA